MLQPCYEGGTLKDVLESSLKDKPVTEDLWMRWAGQLLKSVESLHKENVRLNLQRRAATYLFERCMRRADYPSRPQAG